MGWDIIGGLGERAARFVGPSTAFVIGDAGAREHAERARISLENAGIAAHLYVMEAGEQNKTLQSADAIYGWLAKSRAERKHLVVAVGGGVVGDLAGFVGGDLPQGHALRAGTDNPPRHARRLDRWQDSGRSALRKEPGRGIPPAPVRVVRRQHPHKPVCARADGGLG